VRCSSRRATGGLERWSPRQNPAYRPATEKALVTGLFLWIRFAGDSSGSPRGGLTAVSVEPPGTVAQRGLAGCAGYEPLRTANATTHSALNGNSGAMSRSVGRARADSTGVIMCWGAT
jgi:hypothetical protein